MPEIKYPKGFKTAPGYTKLAVSFPDDLFKAVMKMARVERIPFNVMVLNLIRCGKLCLGAKATSMNPKGVTHHEEVTP